MITFLTVLCISCTDFRPSTLTTYPDPEATPSNKIVFMDLVEKIFIPKCLSCHHEGSFNPNPPHHAMLDLMLYLDVIQTVTPGQPMKSKLYKVVFADLMPPAPQDPITDDEKQLIFDWIKQGAIEK